MRDENGRIPAHANVGKRWIRLLLLQHPANMKTVSHRWFNNKALTHTVAKKPPDTHSTRKRTHIHINWDAQLDGVSSPAAFVCSYWFDSLQFLCVCYVCVWVSRRLLRACHNTNAKQTSYTVCVPALVYMCVCVYRCLLVKSTTHIHAYIHTFFGNGKLSKVLRRTMKSVWVGAKAKTRDRDGGRARQRNAIGHVKNDAIITSHKNAWRKQKQLNNN